MQISEAESAVMEVLWRGPSPMTSEDVVAALMAGEPSANLGGHG